MTFCTFDDQRNDGHRLTDASRLGDHADLEHLGLDLVEPRKQPLFARALGNENAGRPGDRRRLHDVARPQDELIDPSVDAGMDRHFVQLDLSCRKLRLRARLLRRQDGREARFCRRFGGGRRVDVALPCRHEGLQLLELARCDDVRIALYSFVLVLIRPAPADNHPWLRRSLPSLVRTSALAVTIPASTSTT